MKVSVIAVQLWVNGTDTLNDDYVAKEKSPTAEPCPANDPMGAPDNHIPLKANLLGPQGTTCHLKLSSTGGGQVRFTKADGTELAAQGEPITVGTALNLRLYGTSASAALNDVQIEARTAETGGDICGTAHVTVIWFNEADLHFRGSDHQDEPLTPGSTATFTQYYGWMADVVGKRIYPNPEGEDWDWASWQMEIACQPNPTVLMPNLTWDIRRAASAACWGPGSGQMPRQIVKGANDWAGDDDGPEDEDLEQNQALPSLFVADAPGNGLPYVNGYRFSMKAKFREWVEVRIGSYWYVCSPFKPWRAIIHVKLDGNGWVEDNFTNEVVPGGITGFAGSWTDEYGLE